MKYLPFENLNYKTKLTAEEILERLGTILDSDDEPESNQDDSKPYRGYIVGNSFKLVKIIAYRNSFIPQIHGQIIPNISGTEIKIKMRLNTLVLIFMIIWFTGVGAGCAAGLSSISENPDFEPGSLLVLGMPIFGYVLMTGAFKIESIKSKKLLAKLFEAEIIE